MAIDISKFRHPIAEKYHYSHDEFKRRIAPKIVGKDGTWANCATPLQSCAIRLSIALAYAGVHFPKIDNSWRLKDSQVYFPSFAADYPGRLLAGGVKINDVGAIRTRRGAIYFGGNFNGASGHVTLWNGEYCHFDGHGEDSWWSQPTILFWEMRPK